MHPFIRQHHSASILLTLALSFGIGASAAFAQDGQQPIPAGESPASTCGQPAALTQLLPSPVDRAGPARVALSIARTEPRYVEFTLQAATAVTLQTQAGGQGVDPVLVLYDSGGEVVAWDDDGGGGLDSRIAQGLGAGTYCAQVRLFGVAPQPMAQVDLQIEAERTGDLDTAETGSDLPCSDPALVADLGRVLAPGLAPFAQASIVTPESRRDWRLTVGTALTLQIDASSTQIDTVLSLHDAQGNLLAENDDFPGMGTNSRLVQRLVPGEYCASIRGFAGNGGPIRLSMAEVASDAAPEPEPEPDLPEVVDTDPARPCGDPALVADTLRLAPGFGTMNLAGQVSNQSRRDWLLNVAGAITLQADATSTEFDTVLTLLDAAGETVAENDDFPGMGTDSRITESLAPGDYCISVRGFAGSSGAFRLALAEEGAPVVPDVPEVPDAPDVAGLDPAQPCGDPALVADTLRLAPGFGTMNLAGQVSNQSRRDWLLNLEGAITLQTDAMSTEFDTVLTLADAAGETVAENDDYPGLGTDSRITETLEPGDYCISVRGFAGSSGAFRLALAEEGTPPVVPDLTDADPSLPCGDAELVADVGRSLVPGFGELQLEGEVRPDSRRDWRVNVGAPVDLRIDATSVEFDTVLSLHDAAGNRLAENDDYPGMGTDSRLSETLQPADYCISVRGFGGSAGRLALALMEEGAGPEEGNPVDLGEAIPGPDSGVAIEELGELLTTAEAAGSSASQTMWAAFSVTTPSTVRIEGLSLGGPFILRLYRENGTLEADASGEGGLGTAGIERDIFPGRYYVALTHRFPDGQSRLRQLLLTRHTGG